MNAPTAAPARHRHHPHLRIPHPHLQARPHPSASWVVPVVLGILYGGWAMFIDHNQGTPAPWAALLGVVAAVVVGALCYLVGRVQSALMPELRSAAYGALFGCAFGFMYSLSGHAVFRSSMMGLGGALAMYAASLYVFRTRSMSSTPAPTKPAERDGP
ncbi:hypothetical protein [Streptomyces sp. ME19-01-6]|uniref:hypothetical protein n=1 Tax=Streptomyces sp. ME19-01-6 TaxID=3028686 RepID=UPI0029A2060A|nr:hypothetical protein [Streptomyces sp. ME19-01-6]MDX3226187.1 hypothetical protein [Streptomyces sp. ME19-01-6]